MTKAIRLNDLQLVLLSHAAKNDKGSIHPLPEVATRDDKRAAEELNALLRRKLVAEVEVMGRAQSWRTDGDCRFGLVLTAAAREALGLEGEQKVAAAGDLVVSPPTRAGQLPSATRSTKAGMVLALLQRSEGATLDEMPALPAGSRIPLVPCSPASGRRVM